MFCETFSDFKDTVNQEVDRRMALYKHYTQITPKQNARKHQLSFYRGRRDHKRSLWQDVQEADVRSLGYSCLSEWDPNGLLNVPEANPDIIAEIEQYEPQFSLEEHEKAAKLIKQAARFLTPTEMKVFVLTQQGMGSTDTARRLGMRQGSVTTLMSRIAKKVRKAYALI